ncbi:MAG: transglycosylase SLT domain-containing protein, partial [Dongiaceae bacterium]
MNTAWLHTLMAGPVPLTGKSIANSGHLAANAQDREIRNPDGANTHGIQPNVVACIQKASASTGVDFSYLMAQAARESSFDPNAKATTSTAHGLYQFVEQTWLSVVKDHGAEYGYGNLASQISTDSDGRMVVKNAAVKKEILGLRRDPQLSSEMAAEHAADNQEKMEKKLGRSVTGTDLYLAHFLGVQGALKFLGNMKSDPNAAAADVFPAAADANAKVFYRDDGSAKSLREVYSTFGKKISADMAAYRDMKATPDTDAGTALASNSGTTDAAGSHSLRVQLSQLLNNDGDQRVASMSSGRAVFGQANPGGILSPVMLMTLAGLPTAGEISSDSDSSKHSHGHKNNNDDEKPRWATKINAFV